MANLNCFAFTAISFETLWGLYLSSIFEISGNILVFIVRLLG